MSTQALDGIFFLKLAAIVFAIVGMLYGAWGVFGRLKQKNTGFGPSSLQALAITFFLPTIVIVAVVAELDKQAMAALLGTIAGYVLSSPKKNDGA